MIDENELVVQERERLQMLQVEWEEKFREGEIQASLERAKLSRERQELANTQGRSRGTVRAPSSRVSAHARKMAPARRENGWPSWV